MSLTASISRPCLLAGAAACALFAISAHATTTGDYQWTQVSRWREDARLTTGGNVVYQQEWFPAKGYDVRPHQVTRTLFPEAIVGDGNNKVTSDNLWVALSGSSNVIGNTTTLTRARDAMEDWDINFVAPGVSDKNYWFNWYTDNSTNFVLRSAFPLTLVNGPQAGQSLLNNNNLLAMGDDNSLWLDRDGTLSYYNYPGGTLEFDSLRTTFAGGPTGWNGATLTSKLNTFIGYEEGKLYFLEGASTLQVFSYDLGYLRTDNFAFNGDLAGYSLGDVVDGKVKGAVYLGWDVGPVVAMATSATLVTAVPEPASWTFMALGLLGMAAIRHRTTQAAAKKVPC